MRNFLELIRYERFVMQAEKQGGKKKPRGKIGSDILCCLVLVPSLFLDLAHKYLENLCTNTPNTNSIVMHAMTKQTMLAMIHCHNKKRQHLLSVFQISPFNPTNIARANLTDLMTILSIESKQGQCDHNSHVQS